MSEGTLFTHTQRWPPSVSAGGLPNGAPRSSVDCPAAAAAAGGGFGTTMFGQAAILQQQQQHHQHLAHLNRTQSEVSARPSHEDHLKRLHSHWSDTGLLHGQHAAQAQHRWVALLAGGDDGNDSSTQIRRNSLDSARAAAERGKGATYSPRPAEEALPRGSWGYLDSLEYAQRPGAAPAAGLTGQPAADLQLQQQWQLQWQQWDRPVLAQAAAADASRSGRRDVCVGPAPPPLVLLQQPGIGLPTAAAWPGGSDDASSRAREMYRPRSGTDLTVEGFVQLQRCALEKVALEVHRQETCLRTLHSRADQLSHALEQVRTRRQALAAAGLCSGGGVGGGGHVGGGISSGNQLLPSGRAKELVGKLRLENSCLLADIEDLERELIELRFGGTDALNQGRRLGGPQGSSTPQQLRRGNSAPAPSEGIEQAEHTAHTWPAMITTMQTQREPLPQQHRGQDLFAAPSSSSRATSGASLTSDESDPSGWNCDICTFLNHAMLNVCEICEAPRMTGRPAARTACCHQTGCYCHVDAHGGGHI